MKDVDNELLALVKEHPRSKELVEYLLDNYGALGDGCGCCEINEFRDFLPNLEDL